MNATPHLEVAAACQCQLGENPLWDETNQRLLWTDITRGRLFQLDHTTGHYEQFYSGETVGGFTIQVDGSLLLFQVNKISRFARAGQLEVLKGEIDSDMERFNDVIADPGGRVFAGTIGKDDQRGGLYRLDVDGSMRNLFKGTGCSNGMGFSPDLKWFYWTCSTTRVIYRFSYDVASGEIGSRTKFIVVPPSDGIPDGMAVDGEGHIWSARWDGYSVAHYDPTGKLVETVSVPVARVSSVTFGGPQFTELYITTARREAESVHSAGDLYRTNIGSVGRAPFLSRILLLPGSEKPPGLADAGRGA